MVTGLRSFFRFAQLRGVTKSDLAALVPSVPSWEMSGPPKHLPTEAVRRVLSVSAHNRSTVKGKRDYAILLLLARLGLRAGEIVALQLDDIDWANGELVVRSKKGDGWARLPLPVDVGQAMERYLMVRPSPSRNVFVRGFAQYLSGIEPKTEVPPSGPIRRGQRPQPYIYSDDEIIGIMKAIWEHPSTPRYALKPHTLYCLFGLLSVTGMRLTEALSLRFEDIDRQNGVLTIGRAKFQKSRLVPLHKSALQELRTYIEHRNQFFAERPLETPSKSNLCFDAWGSLNKQ
jgi:integrase